MRSSKVITSQPRANATGPVNQQRRDNASCRVRLASKTGTWSACRERGDPARQAGLAGPSGVRASSGGFSPPRPGTMSVRSA